MKLDEQVRERLAALIEKGEAVLTTHKPNPPGIVGFPTLDGGRYTEWRSQVLVCLTQVFGSSHTYTASFDHETSSGARRGSTESGLGVLRAALEDVEQGHLATLEDMATAEVFSDFLDQADHLLQNGYAAPAASLAGAVLENGLRSIAERNEIVIKARDDLSALNSRLGAKGIYNRLRQKEVSVWIDVRNLADHGRFDDLTEENVEGLIRGVRSVLAEML